MRFIVEFDGVLADVMPALYAAHREAAASVGWSRVDEATFRRLIRTKGREADVLPGAKAVKVEAYERAFRDRVEEDASIASLKASSGVGESLRQFGRLGTIVAVTLGTNLEARRAWLGRQGWAGSIESFERLDADPRRRPAELRILSENDSRTVVVAPSDALVRSADAADLFTVAVSSGTCSVKRLQQAGPRVVYRELAELAESLKSGGADLVRAGLLPIA